MRLGLAIIALIIVAGLAVIAFYPTPFVQPYADPLNRYLLQVNDLSGDGWSANIGGVITEHIQQIEDLNEKIQRYHGQPITNRVIDIVLYKFNNPVEAETALDNLGIMASGTVEHWPFCDKAVFVPLGSQGVSGYSVWMIKGNILCNMNVYCNQGDLTWDETMGYLELQSNKIFPPMVP